MPRHMRAPATLAITAGVILLLAGCSSSTGGLPTVAGQGAAGQTANATSGDHVTCESLSDKEFPISRTLDQAASDLDNDGLIDAFGQYQALYQATAADTDGKTAEDFQAVADDFGQLKDDLEQGRYDYDDWEDDPAWTKYSDDLRAAGDDCGMPGIPPFP